MEKSWLSPEKAISSIVHVALNAKKSTPTWEEIDDHKTRLAANKLLLEMAGIYQPSSWKININLWFAAQLYEQKPNNESPAEIIVGDAAEKV